jgi:hypothetical protein
VLLIPIDSFPHFPVSSVYRPLAILPLLGVLFYAVFSGKLNLFGVFLGLISLLLGLHAVATTVVFDYPTEHLSKSIATSLLLAVMLSAFSVVFNPRIISPGERRRIFGFASFLALVCTFLFVVIQFLSSSIGALQSLSNELTSLISYRSVGRVQGMSGEPSQLIRNTMLIGMFSMLLNRGVVRLLSIALCSFIVLVSGSTYGYLLIAIFAVIYIVLFEIKALANIKVLSGCIVFSVLLSYFYTYHMGAYSQNKVNKVVEVFDNPGSLVEVIETDGSIFQRLMNPYIGFTSFGLDNVFGRGLDTYRYEYPNQILTKYSYALEFDTVANAVSGHDYITPKSLYSKVYFELGWLLFGFMLFAYLLLYIKVFRTSFGSDKYILRFSFCLAIVYPINTDSVIFFNYWVSIMVILSSVYYRSRLF